MFPYVLPSTRPRGGPCAKYSRAREDVTRSPKRSRRKQAEATQTVLVLKRRKPCKENQRSMMPYTKRRSRIVAQPPPALAPQTAWRLYSKRNVPTVLITAFPLCVSAPLREKKIARRDAEGRGGGRRHYGKRGSVGWANGPRFQDARTEHSQRTSCAFRIANVRFLVGEHRISYAASLTKDCGIIKVFFQNLLDTSPPGAVL